MFISLVSKQAYRRLLKHTKLSPNGINIALGLTMALPLAVAFKYTFFDGSVFSKKQLESNIPIVDGETNSESKNQKLTESAEKPQTENVIIEEQSGSVEVTNNNDQALKKEQQILKGNAGNKTSVKQSNETQKSSLQSNSIPKLYQSLSAIPSWSSSTAASSQWQLIVAAAPYTIQFQKKILNTINQITQDKNSQSVNDTSVHKISVHLLQTTQRPNIAPHVSSPLKEELIFLLKSPYDSKYLPIDFEMYMLHPNLIRKYVEPVKLATNATEVRRILNNIGPFKSILLHVVDSYGPSGDEEQQRSYQEGLLTAKLLEMQLSLHKMLDQSVELIVSNKETVQELGLAHNPAKNSLHLLKMATQHTFGQPNYRLADNNQNELINTKKSIKSIPQFHLMNNIALFNRNGDLLLQQYLNQVEIFATADTGAPYLCQLIIDRNRIDRTTQKHILNYFKIAREDDRFKGKLSFMMKMTEVPAGSPARDWSVRILNFRELDRYLLAHEVKNTRELEAVGLKEDEWLKHSYEYQYPHTVFKNELFDQFAQAVFTGDTAQHFKSEPKSDLTNIPTVTSADFKQKILQDGKNHLVFQYSDSCLACKQIAPSISLLHTVTKSLQNQAFYVHKLNCDRNRLANHLYSPYTPNLYFYKADWKNNYGPIRYPIDRMNNSGLIGLFQFSMVASQIKTIDWDLIQRAKQQAKRAMELV